MKTIHSNIQFRVDSIKFIGSQTLYGMTTNRKNPSSLN